MRWILAALFLCMSSLTLAGHLQTLKLEFTQSVYLLPRSFDPPVIEKNGIAQIEDALLALDNPFYLIIVRSLDMGKTGEDSDYVLDELVDGWQIEAGLDAHKVSVLLVVYGPILKTTLWVHADLRQDPMLKDEIIPKLDKIFSVSPDRKQDPVANMIAIAQAVDKLISQKQVSPDVALEPVPDIVEENDEAILGEDPEAIVQDDSLIEPEDVISADVDVSDPIQPFDRPDNSRLIWTIVAASVVVMALLVVLIMLFLRGRKYRKLEKAFYFKLSEWRTRIRTAQQRYEDIVQMCHDSPRAPDHLFWTFTTLMDDINLQITAMDMHVAECNRIVEMTSGWELSTLRMATENLHSSFRFDPRQLKPEKLLGSSIRTLKVTIHPTEFLHIFDRLDQAEARWYSLMQTEANASDLEDPLFCSPIDIESSSDEPSLVTPDKSSDSSS